MDDREARDSLEVTDVERGHGVAEKQRRRPDQQVGEGDADSLSRLLPLNPSSQLGDFERHRLNRDRLPEFLDEGLPPLSIRFRLGTVDAMGQFNHGHRRERSFRLPKGGLYPFENIPHALPAAFACDQHAGVKD